jgi:hypothetical protein
MNATQQKLAQKKAYLKRLTKASDKARLCSDTSKAIAAANKALNYGLDWEWLANSDNVTARERNSFRTLIRRNEWAKKSALAWEKDLARFADEDWNSRRRAEAMKAQMGLSNNLARYSYSY